MPLTTWIRSVAWTMAALLWVPVPAVAQDRRFTSRGFIEGRGFLYPQTPPNDNEHVVAEVLARYEPAVRLGSMARVFGSFDARADSHDQTDDRWRVDWSDRTARRPPLSVRRLSVAVAVRRLTIEAGKQFVRWGKADILNPTDRFAPRDFLTVIDDEFLGITAARATYERGRDTFDVVWAPRFTPSRVPLLDQRWTVLPEPARAFRIEDAGAVLPARRQVGGRWSHIGSLFEFALSVYDGFNHLPRLQADVRPASASIVVRRAYARIRMYGGDAAVPLRWFTLKGEVGYFTTDDRLTDEYLLYVVQLERQLGEWSLVGGYAGQSVTVARSQLEFAPDRGLARAVLGRASYTIDPHRSFAIELAVRQNGHGVWLKGEFSHAFGQRWRATMGVAAIMGDEADFLGQYHRNSHATTALRFSF
ncbi:MAG: hypothetical protein HYX76_06990 [Acidobacteria bacterium]|nr:hypothetical protein [Acidobacteriota bacterium]